jgi:hypothetical protein
VGPPSQEAIPLAPPVPHNSIPSSSIRTKSAADPISMTKASGEFKYNVTPKPSMQHRYSAQSIKLPKLPTGNKPQLA